MKVRHIIFLIISAVTISVQAVAVEPDALGVVKSDRLRACGHEGPYRFEEAGPLTPAPAGYEAFYVSHYGRHGSRYAWNPETYEVLSKTLDGAAEKDALTPRGKRLQKEYSAFVPGPAVDYGQLSRLGWEQLERLGKQMYDNFPEVFAGDARVLARSSTSQRAILSMASFCIALQKCNPRMDIDCRSLASEDNVMMARSEVVTPWIAVEREVLEGLETIDEVRTRLIPVDEVMDLLFTDRSIFADKAEERTFVRCLYDLWTGYHNYSDDTFLEDIFTPDQIARLWESRNYSAWYSTSGKYLSDMDQLLLDIEKGADEAIAGRGNAADLRFGHDYVINGFIRYINLDGMDFTPTFAGDVKKGFQNYNVPMASNIQFVFYRNADRPSDVLFKMLFNSSEATLPQLNPVEGPYYRWDDFKAWMESKRAVIEADTSTFPKIDFGGRTAVVAHRGFWNCEEAGFSENSIASLKAAQNAGFWGSEFDVQMTSDGVVIVNHNDNIEGVRIATHKWSELKGYLLPNGERRPTLDEYLKQGRRSSRTRLVLEFKAQPTKEAEDRLVEKTFAALKANGLYNPKRVVFISFSLHICEKVAAEAPQFVNQYLNGELSPARLAAKGINGWDYQNRVVARRAKWIGAAHELGMSTNVWTVNKENQMEKFASEGIDAITTNFPLVAREVLGDREFKN